MEVDVVVFVMYDVFEDSSIVKGIIDVGLSFFGEVDGFGVAAAFDVEDSGVGPDVFVISDEFTIWICREGSFSGAGEAEEDGGSVSLRVCNGGAVHGKVTFHGHEIVHEGKDAFFHFSGVFSAEDDHFFFFEADVNGCFRGHAGGEAVGGELTSIVNGDVRLTKVCEFFFGRVDKHDLHEEGMIGAGADDADFDAVSRVPSCVGVYDVKLLVGVEVILGALTVDLKGVFIDRDIDITPPDVIFRRGVFCDALVAW